MGLNYISLPLACEAHLGNVGLMVTLAFLVMHLVLIQSVIH